MSTNSKIAIGAFVAAFIVAVLTSLYLGLNIFNRADGSAPPASKPAIAPAKPVVAVPSSVAPVAQLPRGQIAPPKLPPSQVGVSSGQSADGGVSTPALIAAPPTPEETKAMKNNLRQLGAAAQQYMGEKGVTSASYYDLVGPGIYNYIRNVEPVAGEDYTGIVVHQTDTQVEVIAPDGTSVTFDM